MLLTLLGQKLKTLRNASSITQKELAERMSMSIRHIQNIEAGKVDVKLSTLAQISNIFNVSADSLLKSDELDPLTLTPLDLIPVGIQISDTNGLITYENMVAASYQGYCRSEICYKKYIWDFLADEKEIEGLKQYLKFLLEKQPRPTPYITSNINSLGKTIAIECHWSYIFSDKREIIGFITLINKREKI